jgi:transcription elongation factor GreA-like protein
MFDGSWRDTVTEESTDPSRAFIEGVKVKHQHYGIGEIVSVQFRGATRVLVIDFENGGKKPISMNLKAMEIIEDDYGEDDS